MAEHIELEAVSADGCDEVSKIKTPFAWIIVEGTEAKPYYSILWWDTEKKECNVGYSSYYLKCVFNWLKENFEITEEDADVAPVRHGKWEWDTEDIYRCSNCAEKSRVKEVMGRPAWGYCPNCGCRMDGGDDE